VIPETWLNYVGPDKTEADERHLAENPSHTPFADRSARRPVREVSTRCGGD
jgi:hypothetical protein